MMKFKVVGAVCGALVLLNVAALAGEPSPEQVLEQMKRVAGWQLEQFKNGASGNWINATAFAGFAEMYHIYQDEAFEKQLLAIGERNNWDYSGLNKRPYHADDQCQGQFSMEMYVHKHDPKMLETIQRRMDFALENSPSGGLSPDTGKNKKKCWNWCDALFMAPPVWMRLYALTGEEKYLDYLDQEFWVTSDYLYSPKYKFMFRDNRYFDSKTTNGKPVFWGRGNGWVYGGLARVLELYPEDRPAREKYLNLYKEMTEGILSCRLESGLWPASLLDPEEVPGNEMSASGFFCYGVAWGVNQGVLDKKTYWPIALTAWEKMQDYVLEDGRYAGVQKVADNPKNFTKGGGSTPYGTGAYLLAGSQIYQQLAGKKVDKRALYAAAARKRTAQMAATITPDGMITFMKDGGWCWYQDPRAIINNGKLIIAGLGGQSGDVKVSVYDLEARKDLGTVVLHEKLQRDDHDVPALYARPDGSILAVYAKHGNEKIHYYRISDPDDYLKWGDEQRFVHEYPQRMGVTYMNLYTMKKDGLLYNFFRDGQTWNPSFITSSDYGETWGNRTPFILDEVDGTNRPYVRYLQRNPDTIGLTFTEAHPREFGTSIYYAEFRDGAFYKVDGTKIKDLADGPMVPAEAERVYQGGGTRRRGGKGGSAPQSAWVCAIASDAEAHPHLGYSLYLSNNDHRYRIAQWNGKKWIDREVAYAGKCLYTAESSYTGLLAFDPSDPSTVAISTDVDPATGKDLGGTHEIYVATIDAADTVSSIRWKPVTAGSKHRNIRPIIVSGEGHKVLLWLNGPWNTFRDYNSDVVGMVLKGRCYE